QRRQYGAAPAEPDSRARGSLSGDVSGPDSGPRAFPEHHASGDLDSPIGGDAADGGRGGGPAEVPEEPSGPLSGMLPTPDAAGPLLGPPPNAEPMTPEPGRPESARPHPGPNGPRAPEVPPRPTGASGEIPLPPPPAGR